MGVLGGRYSLVAPQVEGPPEIFACRTLSLSPSSITLAGPVVGSIGQPVRVLLEQIGFVTGTVSAPVQGGFQMRVSGTEEERQSLAAKISWLKSHRLRRAPEKRSATRRPPRQTAAFFYLEDGQEHPCFLIDISLSGAGVSAKLRPHVGTRIVLGSVAATVVRHMDTGFGVAFAEPPSLEALERNIKERRAAPTTTAP